MTDSRDENFDRRAFLTDKIANRPEADPRELEFALDGPLTVGRGETVTHGLLLTNLGSSDVTVRTAGDMIGRNSRSPTDAPPPSVINRAQASTIDS